MKHAFVFDINRCVGCHACLVACANENETGPPVFWRQVANSNPTNHPLLPVFYHSLACNHCEAAPCMSSCPANAFSRDAKTGAVMHHPEKCIGCSYCTWACPYDAPAYNQASGLVEKCTFCNHRLQRDKEPACTQMCPTGALQFGEMEAGMEVQGVQGFTDAGIQPGIQFVPLRKRHTQPRSSQPAPENLPDDALEEPPSKINARGEWPLVIFTLLTGVLAGAFAAAPFSTFRLPPGVFVATGALAGAFSLLHLGRKGRAWRALLNLRTSWLSREIAGYGLFMAGAVVYFWLLPEQELVFWLTTLAGFFTAFSIDRVYDLVDKKLPGKVHSAQVIFTALLFTALFLGNYYNVALVGAFKTVLFVYRKWRQWIAQEYQKPEAGRRSIRRELFSQRFYDSLRLDLLITVPLILWWINPAGLHWWIILSMFAGEVIDRIFFYNELDGMTPQKQMMRDWQRDA